MKHKFHRQGRFLILPVIVLGVLAHAHLVAGGERSSDKQAAEAYQKAYELILSKDYAKAQAQYKTFMKEYRDSHWYDDAYYWYCYSLSESTNRLEKAFECYDEFIANHPDSKWREEAEEDAVLLAKKLAKTDPKYKKYLNELRRVEEEELTQAIIMALVEKGGDETLIELIGETTNPDTRRWLVFALGDCSTPACKSKLIEIAKTDPDVELRRHAMYSLSESGNDDEVIPLMLEMLETEKDIDTRRQCVWIIADSDDPMVADALFNIALTEKDADMARAATYGLANLDDPRVTEVLEQLVQQSTDIEIKRAALYALVEREDVAILGTLKQIATSDGDADLQRAATWAIAEMKDEPEAAKALVEIFNSSKDVEVRRAALYGLAGFDSEIAIELLKEVALSADDEELATAAMHALFDQIDDGDLETVMEIYEKTPYPDVRRAAMHVLLNTKRGEALPVLAMALKTEKDPDIRATIVWAMQDAEEEVEAVKILTDVAKNDPSTRVRRAAIQVLGEIDSEEAHDALLEILKERNKKKDD